MAYSQASQIDPHSRQTLHHLKVQVVLRIYLIPALQFFRPQVAPQLATMFSKFPT